MQIMTKDPYAFGDDGGDTEDSGPSKSEIKRQMLGLQELGASLTELSDEALKKVPLPEELLQAVLEFRKIRTFKARQRHIQHIGKLLRQADAEQIRTALRDAGGTSPAMVALHHKAERLREKLLESDNALTDTVNQYPGIDLQKLRQCIRNARNEAKKPETAKKNPRYAREIYQILHAALLEQYRQAAADSSDGGLS